MYEAQTEQNSYEKDFITTKLLYRIMPISFREGYRTVSWIYAEYDKNEQRKEFASMIFDYLSKARIEPYLGVCFGKFSRVLDFFHRSAKNASFHLGNIQSMVNIEGIRCSFSTILCKPFDDQVSHDNDVPAVNAYTFFKPASENLPYDQVLDLCRSLRGGENRVSSEAYWNNSMYPLVIITRGQDYHSVVEFIRRLRIQSEWAVDSSSYITLKIDSSTHDPVKDETKGIVSAIIYLKLRSLSDIDKIIAHLSGIHTRCPFPAERFGWYDICDIISCKTLYELYENGLKLKTKYKDTITFTSSLLLKEGGLLER